MFVGHELLAFALVGWGASRLGSDGATALRLGSVAALAALLPDLDVVYAVATYAAAVADGTPLGWEAFWGVANGVHRVVTHPLPTGAVATLVFGAVAVGAGRRTVSRSVSVALAALALAGFVGLLATFRAALGVSAALVAAAFLLVVGLVGATAGRRVSVAGDARVAPAALSAAAGVGFLTHPFGDVFLAAPPPLLSPVGPPLLTSRVVIAADPTLNLLGILFVEVATVWAGVAVFARLDAARPRLRDAVDVRAAVGVGYAPAALLLPRPTIADAHVLGFTAVPLAVAVALWVGWSSRERGGRPESAAADRAGTDRLDTAYVAVVSGLTTLTLAGVAYGIVHVFV
ncbi:hydrolase [Halobellus sp. Atlit-31R]|nr:hydrolase [Halobellus sp. Atlit-31R]